jgi:hypothetical protein
MIWVWWSTGITRRAAMSVVHAAESLEAGRTLCGAAMTIGRSKYHRARPFPDGEPKAEDACKRCLLLRSTPKERRASRLAEGNAHLAEAVEALDAAMKAFRRAGKDGENHHAFARRAWSALVTVSPENYAEEQARRDESD